MKVSTEEESFSHGLLEHPQYTRPAVWNERPIPLVLQSGNHGEIAKWRQAQAEDITIWMSRSLAGLSAPHCQRSLEPVCDHLHVLGRQPIDPHGVDAIGPILL